MIAKVFALAAFVAIAQAGYLPYEHSHAPIPFYPAARSAPVVVKHAAPAYAHVYEQPHDLPADHKYEFKYSIDDPHSGDHKSQHEVREGDAVKGFYKVADADGTLRTVHYTADAHNGFRAVVDKTPLAPAPAPVPAIRILPYADHSAYAAPVHGWQ